MRDEIKKPDNLDFKDGFCGIAIHTFRGVFRYGYKTLDGTWWQVGRDYKSRASARRAGLDGVCKKKVSHEKVS